jgi:O-succinylbenzoic acid--CoA ligase
MDHIDRYNILEPDSTALVTETESLTYRRLYELVSRAGGAYEGFAVRPGERVAVWATNTAEAVVALWAASRQGAVAVPLNTRLTSLELDAVLDVVSPALVVGDDSMPATSRNVVSVDSLTSGNPAMAQPHLPEDVHSILFTTGSAGDPKAVPLTWSNLEASAQASTDRTPVGPESNWLCALPIFHAGGYMILYRVFRVGGTVTLHQRFEPPAFAAALSTTTHASVVPAMLGRLLDGGVGATPSLQVVLVGGAPAAVPLLKRASDAGLPVAPTYGMTEAASQIATAVPGDARIAAGTCGKLLAGAEVRLMDDGVEAYFEEGEIHIRGAMVFGGYLGEAALEDGWHATGDLGRLDEEGYLYVTGRVEELIITGGENVRPAEVEEVLMSHPLIRAALVVGVPDPEWGERVAAVYVADEEVTDLLQFSGDRLAGYKAPRPARRIDAIPMLASGKPDRRAVVELLAGVE